MEEETEVKFECIETAFNNRLKTYKLFPKDGKIIIDISSFLEKCTRLIGNLIMKSLEQHRNVKVNCFMECMFEHQMNEEEIKVNFKTKNINIYGLHDLPDFHRKIKESLETEAEEMEVRGSGWSFVRVNFMELRINKLNQLRGGAGVSLPTSIKNSKSVVNVINSGQECFKFAVYGKFINNKRLRSRSIEYLADPEFNARYSWDCITYPVSLSDITIFEKRNDISINVYGATETNVIYPLRIADQELPDHRDLLLYQDHYCWITNLQRLISRQIDHVRRSYFCKRCFSQFTSENGLLKHIQNCSIEGIQADLIENVPIPKKIKERNAIIYILSKPENSFKAAIIDGLEEEVAAKYDWSNVSNVKTTIDNVKYFQDKNDNISINVYSFTEEGTIFPIHVGNKECVPHRDLLFVKTSKGNYFYQITDLSRLVCKQKTKHKNRVYICKRCLAHFPTEERLNVHRIDCIKREPMRTILPVKGKNILKFTKIQQNLRVPYVIYADWESLLIKLSNNDTNAKTHRYQEHEPFAFCYYIIATDGTKYAPRTYMGPNAIPMFFKWLVADVEKIVAKYKNIVPMIPLTPHQQVEYDKTTDCLFCHEKFTVDNPKVRDHCHLTGKYRHPLCSKCNRAYQNPTFIPVLLHNFSKYDANFIIRGLGYDAEGVSVLANTEENFISVSKKTPSGFEIRFLDSFRFMPESLEKLAKNLPLEMFKNTKRFFQGPKELDIICRKQVLCYDYLSSWEVLNDTELPPKDKFYNTLNECDISDEDYAHANTIWKHFGITSLGDYVKLYLETDVLILADVFEGFRDVCLNTFGIDACWNYSSPGLSWQSFLKYTKVEIELLTDQSMYSLFRQATRGGISQCSLRHIEADIIQPGEITETSTSIGFVDVVNLYGYSMSFPLPHGGFRWMTREEIDNLDVVNTTDDDKEGYLLDCDLIYPEHLHNHHNELPFLPENQTPPNSKYTKLLATLHDKVHYPLHIRVLRQALAYGLKLKCIHRGIAFKQSRFLKPYIDLNTEMRKVASNDFEKNFFKLMINSCYGKTMENKEGWLNFEIVTSAKRFEKVVASNNFKYATVIDENVVGISKLKTLVSLDRPIFAGASVLDISKTIVYELFYGHYKKLYGNAVTLAYMDTDSLLMKMKGFDINSDILRHPEIYDTSNYPENHLLFSERNKKSPGKLTNEAPDQFISQFVGLRSKVYAMAIDGFDNKYEKKRCKGVKRNVVGNLKLQDFRRCLYDNSEISLTQNVINSKNHRLFSSSVCKLSLSPRDDKRVILEDKVSTLAYGHYRLKKLESSTNPMKRKAEDCEGTDSKRSKLSSL